MSSEEIKRSIRENPEILIDALNDALTTNPDALLRALMNRPEVLIRVLLLTASLPLVIPTILLRLLTALVLPMGQYGDVDALRARINDVEKRLGELESKIITKGEVEMLFKELISKYGVKDQRPL
ncbi:hypothetical protein [Vulcanisaeta souniana]|uniref:Uncharacterized protein n=1 Tax=Vulcanisaeta souniana JCM 11219 TaxID=1293586 RepID=A0A830E421_9CREN|nr:hypothetical protein [Vulcanisaeta souniana]BDR91111.1 hypothetical protein Vsou_02040 [Vulcanisaeta souniana JCM 11219]GGI80877.1 hypothetical protein GCM10007112_17120 [Vulcanisaeta souniana JCM 11219]